MTLVFIHWNEGPWFDDVLRCAKARCGCPILVVSDRWQNKDGVDWLEVRDVPSPTYSRTEMRHSPVARFSILRWFILESLFSSKAVPPPVFTPDWDDLVLANLEEACQPFAHCHYATTFNCRIPRSPLLINNRDCVTAYADMARSVLNLKSPRLASIRDKNIWSESAAFHDWTVGDLTSVQNGSVFDHSIAYGTEDGYIMHDGIKKLDWYDGVPYFYLKPGRGVRANSIQCWDGYKSRIPEFCKLAGL